MAPINLKSILTINLCIITFSIFSMDWEYYYAQVHDVQEHITYLEKCFAERCQGQQEKNDTNAQENSADNPTNN